MIIEKKKNSRNVTPREGDIVQINYNAFSSPEGRSVASQRRFYVSNISGNNVIVHPVTSNLNNAKYAKAYINDWYQAGLLYPSTINISTISNIPVKSIKRIVGHVTSKDYFSIRKKILHQSDNSTQMLEKLKNIFLEQALLRGGIL